MAKQKNKSALFLALCLTLNLPAFALSEEAMKLRITGKEFLQAGKYRESIESLKKAYFQSGMDNLVAKDLAEVYFARAKTHENDPEEMLDDICYATFYDNDSRQIVLLKGKAITSIFRANQNKQAAEAAKALEDGKPEVAIVLATELIYAQGAPGSTVKDTITAALKKLNLKAWPRHWEQDKIDYSPYMNTVSSWLRGSWAPPHANKSSRVEVSFNIKRNGEIKGLKVIQSSGVPLTDKAAMDAVKLAVPFRIFEKGWPDEVTIEFNFDYNQHAKISEEERNKIYKSTLDAHRVFEEGKRAFERKDYKLAIEKYQKALDTGSEKSRGFFTGKVVDALLAQGEKQLASNKESDPLDDVLKCYFQAYYLEPDYWLIKESISKALQNNNNNNSGISTNNSASPVDTVKKLSDRLEEEFDLQTAAGAFRWLSENGGGSEYKDKYNKILTRAKTEPMVKRWRDQVTLTPKSVDSHLGLGIALEKIGSRDEAEEEFKKVLELDRHNALAKKHLEALGKEESKD